MLQGTFSINQQQDDRLEQARPSSVVRDGNGAHARLGYVAQGTLQPWHGHVLTTGAEFYDEAIATSRDRWQDGAATPLRPEIPDGGGLRIGRGIRPGQRVAVRRPPGAARRTPRRHLHLRRAGRRTHSASIAERVRMSAITFNTGLVWSVTEALNVTGSVNRGFRAANAFDLGAIGVSGGGFEVAPREASDLRAIVGTNDGPTAVSSGVPVTQLGPESMYAFEGGVKVRTRRLAGSLVLFDLELQDAIARRTAIFPEGIVGTSIAGYPVVAQDAAGRAYVAVDPRPIVTRVNVERGRIQGLEGDVQVRLGRAWIGNANVSLANGRDGDDVYLRRMPPLMGAVRLKWEPSVQPFWAEAVVTAAATQDRLSPGDLSDARIGGRRRRADIAAFFNGTATDLGLVQGGRLVETGETLAQVQARLLNGADATYLYTETPGFVVFSAAWRLAAVLAPRRDGDPRQPDRRTTTAGTGRARTRQGFSLAAKMRVRL